MTLWSDRAERNEEGLTWPVSVPRAMFGAASVWGIVTILGHVGHGPIYRPIAYVVLASLPWALDALDTVIPARVALPLPLFPLPVLIGTGLLVANPAPDDYAAFFLVFLTGEVTSRAEDVRFSVAIAVAAVGLMVGVDLFAGYDGSFVWWIGIAFGWFGGFLIQNLFQRTADLKRAHAGLEQKAAAEERSRVAREVHDVIAHSMSVTMLHITAARMALERGQSPAALESLREAETQGRNSLNDIRRTVGLLGPDSETMAEPMPTVTDLPKLIEDFRTAGLDVKLDMHGDIRGIAPAAGLNIYRIAQESLTNAAKYAPNATANMTLKVTSDEITLCVRNDRSNGSEPRPSGNSLGIRGMIERAALLGGRLQTGADGEGWVVFLTVPREPATA